MMGKIAIVAALLGGLLGLFMTLCGGGFFVMLAYQSGASALPLLAIPAAFIFCGAALFWGCFKFIRRWSNQSRK